MEQMEKINDSLRKITPMLPPCDDDTKSRAGSYLSYKGE
jgi:hypothetical protein